MTSVEERLYVHFVYLYGENEAIQLSRQLAEKLTYFRIQYPKLSETSNFERVSERDTVLITYGDMVQEAQKSHLKSLAKFLEKYVGDSISTVHLLPFYPYSSDDGYSVIDYKSVNPELGSWEDIHRLNQHFRLMFDGVFNHISSQSEWFLGFLDNDTKYQNYFTVVEPGTDLSGVFRPRATPPITPVKTISGEKLVWTTFSADQVDLNYRNPQVLLEIIDTLLFYVSQGAEFIRLDGAAYYWKEIGADSINRPQTHQMIQLMRTVLDIVAPGITIITQTNVAHQDNIVYFGDGFNETQMVYNFALPFLTLDAFHHGNVKKLAEWIATLEQPSDQTTFFNFLAGHDGIGMLPVTELLSEEELAAIIKRTKALGGQISYKREGDGPLTPYELNINYLDALSDPDNPDEDVGVVARRFLSSQAILLALRGVPGVYFHSLLGSHGWSEGVKKTGNKRTVNRQKLRLVDIESELNQPDSLRHHIFFGYLHILKKRQSCRAFHPNGEQKVLFLNPAVFSIWRASPDRKCQALCLHNVTNQEQYINIDPTELPSSQGDRWTDILSGDSTSTTVDLLDIKLAPYQSIWLESPL